jgi:hypothetical protein
MWLPGLRIGENADLCIVPRAAVMGQLTQIVKSVGSRAPHEPRWGEIRLRKPAREG